MSTSTPTELAELSEEQLRSALVWVQAARVATIERFPYLDVALSAMIPVAVIGLGTVATDARWRFYYDPHRTLQQTADGDLSDVIGDWYHKVGHQLRDHSGRWADLTQPAEHHLAFNIAGDALINHDVAEVGLELQDTDVTFDVLPDGVHSKMTTEEIYFALRAEEDHDPRSAELHNEAVSSNGLAQVSADSGGARSGDWIGPGRDGGSSCGSGAGGPKDSWELSDDEDGSVSQPRGEMVREATAEQVRGYPRGHGNNSVPGGLRDWADALLDPLVDWRRELRTVVSKALGQAAGRRDYSWSRAARRRIPGYVLPGMVASAPPRAAAVVDTSGSMSADDLSQCLADIASLTRSAGGVGVQVLSCDLQVALPVLVRNRRQLENLTLTGGGGTDMSVGVRAAARLRPKPDVIITLTDGYTDWPAVPPLAAATAKYVVVMMGDPPEEITGLVPDWMHVVNVGAS